MRILIAGVLGGIAMFIWASVAHVATPLASIGLAPMPNEAATITALHQSLGDKPGLYFFPFMASAAGFGRRLTLAAVVGVIAAMATNLSYWNWYGFSLDYTLANAFTELMKFVFAGLAIAFVLGWGRRSA